MKKFIKIFTAALIIAAALPLAYTSVKAEWFPDDTLVNETTVECKLSNPPITIADVTS